jgi:hypothetical protein
MRPSVIAPFGIAALVLGIWLASDESEHAERAVPRAWPEVAASAAASEDAEGAAAASAPPPLANDSAPSAERAAETAGPLARTHYREPEFRGALVRYLVDSGLSAPDSERVVDAAINELVACGAPSSLDPEGRAHAVCTENALQRAGLDEAILRSATVDGASAMSRRLALEQSWRVKAAVSFRERTR